MPYIKYKRYFEDSILYRSSTLEQLEVVRLIISKVNYCDAVETFNGQQTSIKRGDVWLSRVGLLAEVNRRCKSSIKESHVRAAVDKLTKGGYMIAIKKSRISGTIYRCLERFYVEIAEPFDVRKITYQSPTNHLPITHEQPTNHLRKVLIDRQLDDVATYEQPTNNLPITAEPPQNHHYLKSKEKRIKNNNTIPVENSDSENYLLNKKNKSQEERKKVAAKKESEFVFPSAPAFENPLDVYFENQDNINLFQKNFPLLDMKSEFLRMRDWLGKKAADGNPQHGNFRGFVVKWLNNSEKNRQQIVSEQKNQLKIVKKPNYNGNRKNTAAANGKFIPADKFAKYGSGGLLKL
tara:strand:- start:1158 stop:2207 length:1050 start_codon:yes stop_codon:yes gene_type:complete